MEARLGAQTPEVENTFVNLTPSSASFVRFGVFTVSSPKGGIIGLKSSATIQRIFGSFGKLAQHPLNYHDGK